jgi:predicted nucleic acid-binding protein
MILADSSVWIDHFRRPSKRLAALLDAEQVCVHPFIIGEVACGNLNNRKAIIALLHAIPALHRADDDEILFFIERHSLSGRGIGLIDIHLLASCFLEQCSIWTADRRLRTTAEEMRIADSQ